MSPDEPSDLPADVLPPPPEPLAELVDPENRPAPVVIKQPRTGGRLGGAASALSALAVVALVATAVAGRELRGPPATLTVVVTFLPYLTLALAVWLFALWSLVPDRKLPPVLLTVVGVMATVLWGPAWAARGEVVEGEALRVMSWNVRRLWGGPDDLGDPAACVARAIAEESPDVVSLLEVSAVDVEALAPQLGLECIHSDYTGSGARSTGGIAACVRKDSPWKLRRGWAQRFVDAEAWYYAFAEVERRDGAEGHVVNLLSVHLHPYSFQPSWLRETMDDLASGQARGIFDLFQAGEEVTRGQGAQAKALLERVEGLKDPTIIAGDFNSTRDAHIHARLRGHMSDAWERGGQGAGPTVRFGGTVPLRIDYVYASDDFAVREARTAEVGCSDHAAVSADLILRK
ncbi:MAG: hypothetical protein EP330_10315 [Deltaproteobacteria bacterium]|nr:MAG: hypothetical protein EP330_10315 [Deltaproteobacteria bacterium]